MALFVGTFIALAAVSFVLYPLLVTDPGDAGEAQGSRTQPGDEGAAIEEGAGVVCDRCGPRPEADARFCSSCGRPVT